MLETLENFDYMQLLIFVGYFLYSLFGIHVIKNIITQDKNISILDCIVQSVISPLLALLITDSFGHLFNTSQFPSLTFILISINIIISLKIRKKQIIKNDILEDFNFSTFRIVHTLEKHIRTIEDSPVKYDADEDFKQNLKKANYMLHNLNHLRSRIEKLI